MTDDSTRLGGKDGPEDETRLSPTQATPSSGWLGSSGSIDHGRFQPGEIFQQRYRIIGLLGRGGMGEVYRADDLRLGQPVALKFLPPTLKQDPQRLSQFHNEARTARQVSHPNVCRVYDIGEADGHLFLTMEYVDGEDLSSLLRRIGRLPEDKALEIARQICAGLAAAHERGVIHRDLKPANVMLDGNGKVRIMDFSLAATGAVTGIAGTPAYMAPEQLIGGSVTARSDIYALGLVLYELFTGKRVFEAKSIADLVAEHSSGSITSPAALVKSLDGAIERAILRCLDSDPAKRPASALGVAAALPGGDPLAAALAAGETPSPEMVAAAGGEGATVTATAGAVWLGLIAVLLLAVPALADRVSILRIVPLNRPPAVLLDRAHEIRQSLGFTDQPADVASGFSYDRSYLLWSRRTGSGDPWGALREARPATLLFWIRTSPEEMAAWQTLSTPDQSDPPFEMAGMTRTALDTKGRLVNWAAIPPQLDSKAPPARPMDWAPLFAAAGLDAGAFAEATPARTPPAFADERRAWTGVLPETQTAVSIEAASFRGRAVSFEIVGPWSSAAREPGEVDDDSNRFGSAVLIIVLLVSAVVLARSNLMSGRADRRGAFRLAATMFFIYATFWLLLPHLVNLGREMNRLFTYLGLGLFVGGAMYLVYLAIEPFMRRSWPAMLVGWSRALAGRLPDPVIGRDMLAGVAMGVLLSGLDVLAVLAPTLIGSKAVMPMMPDVGMLEHNRYFLLTIATTLNSGLQDALLTVMMFTVFRDIIRRALSRVTAQWLSPDHVAAGLALVFLVVMRLLDLEDDPSHLWMVALLQFASSGVFLVVLLRFGLLATCVMATVRGLVTSTPLTLQSTAMHTGPAWAMLAVIFAIGAVGWWMARRGDVRPS